MSRYRHHKYTWSKPHMSVNHDWSLVGPIGAVNFHVSMTPGYSASAGLEFHHTEAASYRCEEAPDHTSCPLTGGRCWHDGTSLYAMETLWPVIETLLRSGNHEAIFEVLEVEADRHFEPLAVVNRAVRRTLVEQAEVA